MNNKNIIIAGIAAIGLFLFSQQKKTVRKTPDFMPIKKMAETMAAERLPPNALPTAKKELAEKIYADIIARRAAAAKKIAKKIPEASTPAARRKIAEKKAAAAAAAEKAAKKPVPILLDNLKKNKTPEDIKKKFGSWDTEPKGQETSHKSTELEYSKKKTKEDVMKDFGLWAILTPHRLKSKLKPHAVAQNDNLRKISVKQLRGWIAHAAAQKKTGREVAAWKAEEARRVAAWKAATQKRRIS